MTSQNNCKDLISVDSYSPKEMACKAETVGVTKARLDFLSTFMLAVLAGAFIALGAAFCLVVMTGHMESFGLQRLLGGLSFCLGLILVVVAGAELFTGNTLIVIAFISRKVSVWGLLRNWGIVYLGNLVGALGTVLIVYYAWHWKLADMGVGATAINMAGKKVSLPFATAFCSGIMCNALVCLAVWLCYSARSTTDKILSIIFPITAFVCMGFEHSVANMFFIPYGMALSHTPEFIQGASSMLKVVPSSLTPQAFLLNNLLPVTLGNIVGGAVMVGVVYWIVYLRADRSFRGLAPDDEPREPAETHMGPR